MNTPRSKQPKRFDLTAWKATFATGASSGEFSLAISNPEVAFEFAMLVSEFTHLEHAMAHFVAVLANTDSETAAHILTAIVSAKAKIDLMRTVLERARQNSRKPPSFDEIIDEFEDLNGLRNRYVHAKYITDSRDGTVHWVAPKSEMYPLLMTEYKPLDLAELKGTQTRINQLFQRIFREVGLDIERAKRAED